MKNLFKYIICTLAILSLTASCSRDEIIPNDTPNEKTIHFKFDFAKTVYGDNLARSNNAENASPEECYIKDMVVFIINNGGATFKDYFYTTTPTVNNDIYTVRGGKDLPRGTYRILVVANPVGGAKAFYEKYKDTAPTAIALGSITEKANIDILPASIDSPIPMAGLVYSFTTNPSENTSGGLKIPVTLGRRYAKIRIKLTTTNLRSEIKLFPNDKAARVCASGVYCNYFPILNVDNLGITPSTETAIGKWRSLNTFDDPTYFYIYLPENTDVADNNKLSTRVAKGSILVQIPAEFNGKRIENNYYRIPIPALQFNKLYDIEYKISELGDEFGDSNAMMSFYTSYYEPFFLNQGYCFFDLGFIGNSEPIYLEFDDPDGRFNVQRSTTPISNTGTYTTLISGVAGKSRIQLNSGIAPDNGDIPCRYRIDMVQRPNDPASYDPAMQQDLRKNIPSCHASYRIIIGSKVKDEQDIDFTNIDYFYTTKFGTHNIMKYNVGAYTPPYLNYADSRGYLCTYASSTKFPSLPNSTMPTTVSETTGKWICPNGYHLFKQSEWNSVYPVGSNWDATQAFNTTSYKDLFIPNGLTAGKDGNYIILKNLPNSTQLEIPATGYAGPNLDNSKYGKYANIWFNCDITLATDGKPYALWINETGRASNSRYSKGWGVPARCVKD